MDNCRILLFRPLGEYTNVCSSLSMAVLPLDKDIAPAVVFVIVSEDSRSREVSRFSGEHLGRNKMKNSDSSQTKRKRDH